MAEARFPWFLFLMCYTVPTIGLAAAAYMIAHAMLGYGHSLTWQPSLFPYAVLTFVLGLCVVYQNKAKEHKAHVNRLTQQAALLEERRHLWELAPAECRVKFDDGTSVPLNISDRDPLEGLSEASQVRPDRLEHHTWFTGYTSGALHIIVWRRKEPAR